MSQPRVLLLEFNELCPSLLTKWMGEGRLPNFKRLHDQSDVLITKADVEEYVKLEPWIQWYSMHTGLSFEQHQVFSLTDGSKADHTDIWSVLQGHGYRVASCASMNTRSFAGDDCLYLADPWCNQQPCHPEQMAIYQKVVSGQVQEYTNPEHRLGTSDYVRFGTFLLRNGLTLGTVSSIVGQLTRERLDSNKDIHWKRVALLDRLQFDVFRNYYRKHQPHFATFFLNSTAHLQHAYWRCMEPEAFPMKPTDREVEQYKDAVLFGYQSMDGLLAQVEEMVSKDTVVILATALSQQPFTKLDERGGQHAYRPRDIERLLERLGISYSMLEPVMTHQFQLRFADASARDEAAQRLSSTTYRGQELFEVSKRDNNSIYFGCQVSSVVPEDGAIELGPGNEKDVVPFFELLYAIDVVKSGCHHPDGVLWIRNGGHRSHAERVSILDVFPTVLDMFGLLDAVPASCTGTSLKPMLSH